LTPRIFWPHYGEIKNGIYEGIGNIFQAVIYPIIILLVAQSLQTFIKGNEEKNNSEKNRQNTLFTIYDEIQNKILNKNLQKKKDREIVSKLLSPRIQALVRNLDTERKYDLLKFLIEIDFLSYNSPIVRLNESFFTNLNMHHEFLNGINFNKTGWDKAIFFGAQITNSDFGNCRFNSTDFFTARISNIKFDFCEFDRAFFYHSSITDSTFLKAIILHSNFSHARIYETIFYKTVFENCSFINSYFYKCKFSYAELKGIDFSKADLSSTIFENSYLEYTNFSGANLQNSKFINTDISKQQLSSAANIEGVIIENNVEELDVLA
jgi:uncharacterized protein YjbI with pentapeptide repeats